MSNFLEGGGGGPNKQTVPTKLRFLKELAKCSQTQSIVLRLHVKFLELITFEVELPKFLNTNFQ